MTRLWFRKKDGRARTAGTLFDDAVMMLEDRVMLDAVPTVTVDAPDNILLKAPTSDFTASVRFDNTGADPGYGPYVELSIAKNGADGGGAPAVAVTAAQDDGITLLNATYLGNPVNKIVDTIFDVNGNATNTLTGDVVTGTPGNQFVVLQLPFGSYTGSQTPADITLNMRMSGEADLGVPLAIVARGGFQYGLDPLNNPGVDPRRVGLTSTDNVLPSLAMLTKTASVPVDKEAEISTGPNFPFTYTITLDISDGQTLGNLNISDYLPDSLVYQGITSVMIGGVPAAPAAYTIVDEPVIGSVVNPADRVLSIQLNNPLTASANDPADVQVQFSAYVNDVKFDGTPVINPSTGATTFTENQTTLSSTWTPFDPDDAPSLFTLNLIPDPLDPTNLALMTPTPAPENSFQNQPVVIQKSALIRNDTGAAGLSPGDTVEYILNIQLSDYFTIGDIFLNDILSDGQVLDTSFTPLLTVNEGGVVLTTGNMLGVTVETTVAGDPGTGVIGTRFGGTFLSSYSIATGATTSGIDISAALVMAAALPGAQSSFLGSAGVLSGGRVVSGGATGTTIQVVFRAVVQNNFESDIVRQPDGTPVLNGMATIPQTAATQAVDQGDAVGNDVRLDASIRDNTPAVAILNPQAAIDDGAEYLSIAKGTLVKDIYAINGNTNVNAFRVGGEFQIKAGDEITYRLTYTLPISSFQSLSFADFLPLPVLVAQNLTLDAADSMPDFGEFTYGPNDNFHLLLNATTPSTTFDASANSITFTYPDYSVQNQGPPNQTRTVDLLFTLRIADTTFADGLFLTNLATSSESNTVGNALANNEIIRFQLAQPKLTIQKAIVSATENGAAKGSITSGQTVPGLSFGAAGTASGATIGQTLTDANLGLTLPKDAVAAPNLNSNVTGLDAGDIARVALVINNEGGDDAFDVTFGDTLAAGTEFVGGSIATANLVVVRGGAGGAALVLGVDYVITASTATGFQITLTNNFGTNSAGIGADGVTDGSDILLVTYDIRLANSVAISPTALTSSANIPTYRAVATTGLNLSTNPMEAATIGVAPPTVSKVLDSTSEASTTGANLTIGETADYIVTFTLTEGTISAVRLLDLVPASMLNGRYEVVGGVITSVGVGLFQADGVTSLAGGDFGAFVLLNQQSGGFTGNGMAGGTGITIVAAGDNIANNTITVRFTVRAVDHPDSSNGDTGLNTGQLAYSGGTITGTADIGIALPDLEITKTVVSAPASIDAGDTVSYSITISNPNAVTAYDLNISDLISPGGLLNNFRNVVITGAVTLQGGGAVAASGVVTLSNAGVLSIPPNLYALLNGQSFTIAFDATVAQAAQAGQVITNTGQVIYSTLAGDQGAVDREITETSGAPITIAATGIDKTIQTTSVGGDASTTVVVGETITYNLLVTVSEGATNSFVITDSVLAMPAGLVLVSGQVISIGADITGSLLANGDAGTLVDTNGDGVFDRITFTFGDLINVSNNAQTAADQIVVRVTARVADGVGNVGGTVLANTGTASSVVGGTPVTQSDIQNVTVGEPLATVMKTVDNLPAAMLTAATGDIVAYRAVVTASSGGNFTNPQDLIFTDVLGGGAVLAGGSVTIDGVTIAIGGSGVVGGTTVFVDASADGFRVRFGELAAGATRTILYNATITAGAGNAVNSNATITYDSIGSVGGDSTTDGQADNNKSASDDAPIGTISLTKTITATTVPDTATGQVRAGIEDLAIGESATVQLVLTVPAGGRTFTLTDLLDLAGIGQLTMVGAPSIVTAGVTIDSQLVTFPDLGGNGTNDLQIVFTVNPGSTAGTITITYTALAVDVPGNAAGDQLNLTASLAYAPGVAGFIAGNLDRTVGVDIVEPLLSIDKQIMSVGTPNAGDIVTYSIIVTNNGTGPAYGAVIGDPLPAGLTYVPGTATITVNGITTPVAGSPASVTIAALQIGQTATLTYQALVGNGVVTGVPLVNTATVAADSLPGAPTGRATPTLSDSASIVIEALQGLDKLISSTSDGSTGAAVFRPGIQDLHVGETANFDLIVRLTEGTTGNVVLTDSLLTALGTLTLVGTPTIITTNGITFTGTGVAGFTLVDANGDGVPESMLFDFGTVMVPGNNDPADNFFTIRYTALVGDRPENQAGDTLDLGAVLTTALGTASASAGVDIVAPNVGITKAVSAGIADAGDVKTYTVTALNSGTSTAFDLTIVDALPAGVTIVPGTTVLTIGGVSTNIASPASVPIAALGVGQSAVITFNVSVNDGLVGGTVLTNSATVSYDSMAGAGGRTGGGTATAPFPTAAIQTLDKAIISTTESFTGVDYVRPGATDLTIGERITFELSTGFSEGTTNNVVITDQLVTAAGVLTFIGTPTIVLPAGATITGSVTPQFIDSNGDGVPDQVRFVLGTVVIPGDNDPNNNVIRIRYEALLGDVTANVAGNQLTLPATLTSSSGSLTDSEPVDIVAPVLTLSKVLAGDQPIDGQSTVFLITVGHAAGSTAAATNIVLTEMLPPGALLAGVSVVGGPSGVAINGNIITIPLLRVGETVTIRVTTTVDFAAPPMGDTVNRATIGFGTTTAGPPTGRNVNGVIATATLPFGNPTTSLFRDTQERNELSSIGHYLDYRYLEQFPEIDPVYSGSAAPGTFVTIDVTDERGSSSGFGSGIADAGGNWLVRLPSTTLSDKLERSRFETHYDGARLFRSPNGALFDDRSLLGFDRLGERLSVGSKPAYNTQVVRIHVAGQGAGFGTSFAPAWRDQFFSMEPGLSVEGVFNSRASEAVEGLLGALESPEEAGLNRFNREFLTTADF